MQKHFGEDRTAVPDGETNRHAHHDTPPPVVGEEQWRGVQWTPPTGEGEDKTGDVVAVTRLTSTSELSISVSLQADAAAAASAAAADLPLYWPPRSYTRAGKLKYVAPQI